MTDEEISFERKQLIARRDKINKQYKKDLAAIEDGFKALRAICPHNKTTFHSDPSGNNDSFFSCENCGKEAKRL